MADHEKLSNQAEIKANAAARPAARVRAWIEVLLLIAGVVALALYGAAQADRLLTSRALLRHFPAVGISVPAERAVGEEQTRGTGATASVEGDRAMDVRTSADAPLAVLRIPAIHLEVPVLDGTDALTLNHAAGRIAGTGLPGGRGNIGIAAHRDGFFRNLGKVRVGEPIELETRTGVETYVVEHTQVVMPDNVSVLDPRPAPSLTLVTCYPFHYLGRAPQRYIVVASLTGQRDGSGARAPAAAGR
ncbi:MAG TPA: class D sortase [Acidobacteriaceae bacterium]|jgi:sortase A|nr:class D sortase [Acidobacteriaceae bacterium]